jgi:hypothetical protein
MYTAEHGRSGASQVNPNPFAYAEAVKTLRILNDPGSASALLRHALARFPGDPTLRELVAGG